MWPSHRWPSHRWPRHKWPVHIWPRIGGQSICVKGIGGQATCGQCQCTGGKCNRWLKHMWLSQRLPGHMWPNHRWPDMLPSHRLPSNRWQSHRWQVLTHMVEKQTWLEERLREQYNTGMREISEAGKTAGNVRRKQYVKIGWFFINFSGLISSFELSLCVGLEYVIVLQWMATGPPGKSV